jgi:predicted O-methyltransferase YrrM
MNLIKQFVYKLIQKYDLDKKSLANRLSKYGFRHYEVSAILDNDNFIGKPTDRLLNIFMDLIRETPKQSTSLFIKRENVPTYVFNYYGEHYLLLQALVKLINAHNIVEIGTYTGLSTLSFLHVIEDRKLITVDLVDWKDFNKTVLIESDFSKYNIKQILANFSDYQTMLSHKEIFLSADLIFCDGPKDTVFEKTFLNNLKMLGIKDGCIVLLDDIRQWNMIELWNSICMPKLDITSIGHFTGTGLIEWNNSLSLFND